MIDQSLILPFYLLHIVTTISSICAEARLEFDVVLKLTKAS
jgi:hypothetical protein